MVVSKFMLSISVDEGYAFDLLSIAKIKSNIVKTKVTEEIYERTKLEIHLAIGGELLNKITTSKEYSDLLDANLKVFQLVDEVKKFPCLGGDVDQANYERFLAKKRLQEKFFNTKYKEVKIGY